MAYVAKHEATTVRRPARRERREAGDPGSGEQARQVVGAFVKYHARKHQEVEGHDAPGHSRHRIRTYP